METVTIAVAAGATLFSPVYIAQERGYFTDAGVDVKLIDNAGANAVPMLASGQADLAFSGVTAALALGQQKPTQVVMAMSGGFSAAAVVAGPGITDVSQLKGKRIGTPGSGTTSDSYAHIYNTRLHLNANIVPFTTPAALVAAVKSGQVQAGTGTASLYAGIIADGSAQVILKAGDPEMTDVLGSVKYPEAVLFGLSDDLGGKSAAVTKVIVAIQHAIMDMQTQDASAAAQTLGKVNVYASTPEKVLESNLAYDIPFLMPNAGQISSDDWAYALKQFRDGGVLKGTATPDGVTYAKLINMSYLEKAGAAA